MHIRSSRLTASLAAGTAPAAVIAVISILFATGIALASEEVGDEKALSTANARALPNTYLVTLTYKDGGEALEFSTVTAMRHFSLAPPERRIRFRGRLWLQADGRELLDFSVELGQQVAQKDSDAVVSRDGSWSGSAYVESGRPIKIVENPTSWVSVTLKSL